MAKVRPFGLAEVASPINRWILHIEVPWIDQTSQQRLASKKVPSVFHKINEDLAALAKNISRVAQRTIRPVRLFFRTAEISNVELSDYIFSVGGSEASKFRATVSSSSIPDTKPRLGLEPSHLVKLEITDEQFGWHPGGALAHATLCVAQDKWHFAIQDILLDICMFHSLCNSHPTINFDPATISAEKVKFAASLGTDSYYGPIAEDARYVALASFCRRATQFDASRYLQYWSAVLSRSLRTGSSSISVTLTAKAIVADIRRRHRKGEQISPAKLERLITGLAPGSYFLLRAEKKPRLTESAASLAFFFGQGSWKTGRLAVVAAVNLQRYEQFHPYLSVFQFEVI